MVFCTEIRLASSTAILSKGFYSLIALLLLRLANSSTIRLFSRLLCVRVELTKRNDHALDPFSKRSNGGTCVTGQAMLGLLTRPISSSVPAFLRVTFETSYYSEGIERDNCTEMGVYIQLTDERDFGANPSVPGSREKVAKIRWTILSSRCFDDPNVIWKFVPRRRSSSFLKISSLLARWSQAHLVTVTRKRKK